MGHYCWMCGRTRANERFSGGGHKRHLCKDCARKPRAERQRARALQDLSRFLHQKNISAKNIARLKSVSRSPDEDVRHRAELILQVAQVKPHKRKRNAFLARHHPELLNQLAAQGLILRWAVEPSADPDDADANAWAEVASEGPHFEGTDDAPIPF